MAPKPRSKTVPPVNGSALAAEDRASLFDFVNNAAAALHDLQTVLEDGGTDRKAPSVPTAVAPTAPKQDEKKEAPKFDPAALLDSITEADAPITRSRVASEKYKNNPYVAHLDRSRKTGKPLQLPVPGHSVKELVGYLRDAAEKGSHGLKLAVPKDHPTDATPVVVRFQAVEKRKNAPRKPVAKATCSVCKKEVSVTGDGKLRKHGERDKPCKGSGTPAPTTASE